MFIRCARIEALCSLRQSLVLSEQRTEFRFGGERIRSSHYPCSTRKQATQCYDHKRKAPTDLRTRGAQVACRVVGLSGNACAPPHTPAHIPRKNSTDITRHKRQGKRDDTPHSTHIRRLSPPHKQERVANDKTQDRCEQCDGVSLNPFGYALPPRPHTLSLVLDEPHNVHTHSLSCVSAHFVGSQRRTGNPTGTLLDRGHTPTVWCRL